MQLKGEKALLKKNLFSVYHLQVWKELLEK